MFSIRGLSIVKMSVLSKLIYRFHTMPTTINRLFFSIETDRMILKMYMAIWE